VGLSELIKQIESYPADSKSVVAFSSLSPSDPPRWARSWKLFGTIPSNDFLFSAGVKTIMPSAAWSLTLLAVSRRKQALKTDASSEVSGGVRRVLTLPADGAFAIIPSAQWCIDLFAVMKLSATLIYRTVTSRPPQSARSNIESTNPLMDLADTVSTDPSHSGWSI